MSAGTLEIDLDRIVQRLDDLWTIGSSDSGGVTRLAYSKAENEAFSYLREELPSEYTIREDSIGNIYATRQPDVDRSVYVGSHLDSVYNGGRLDGTLGVITALEAIEAVHASDQVPAYPPTLTIFRAEESARFGQHTIGSRGALGMLTVEAFSATDENDIPLWLAMQRAGFQPKNLSKPTIDFERVAAFLELHIEQGRVLYETGDNVGIVTSVRAPVRYRATVHGADDHSGATPMGLRRDALTASGKMISRIETIANEAAADGDFVATVGDITAVEGAINKVCGEVTFPIDIRSNDSNYRETIENDILEELEAIAARRELDLELELIDRSEPVELDEGLTETLDAAAVSAGTSFQRLPSGGGHDAMNFQLAGISTGMLFVPSVDGISHNPREQTPEVAIREATKTLAKSLLRIE